MNNFTKVTIGWVKQYYEPDETGGFSCTSQEFITGDEVYCENDGGEVISTPMHEYQSFNMAQPNTITD